MHPLAKRLLTTHRQRYGSAADPTIVLAPGRINLIGEHTDYNDGFVFPAAVDRYMVFVVSTATDGVGEWYAAGPDETAQPGRALDVYPLWARYLHAATVLLAEAGHDVSPVWVTFDGNVPGGAGMSSSSAICCGFLYALITRFELPISKNELILMAQRIEHRFIGVQGGIMDQYTCTFGRKGHALLLDCRSLEATPVPLALGEYTLLLINSNVKHSLVDSAFNDRRAACYEGVALIATTHPNVRSLRDVSSEQLLAHRDRLPADVYRKCAFVLAENARTLAAHRALVAGDLAMFGRLLYEGHAGLREQYDVTCPETDLIVELTHSMDTVMGARQMGGGFGGCVLCLVRTDRVGEVRDHLLGTYRARTGIEAAAYQVKLVDGVHVVDTSTD